MRMFILYGFSVAGFERFDRFDRFDRGSSNIVILFSGILWLAITRSLFCIAFAFSTNKNELSYKNKRLF